MPWCKLDLQKLSALTSRFTCPLVSLPGCHCQHAPAIIYDGSCLAPTCLHVTDRMLTQTPPLALTSIKLCIRLHTQMTGKYPATIASIMASIGFVSWMWYVCAITCELQHWLLQGRQCPCHPLQPARAAPQSALLQAHAVVCTCRSTLTTPTQHVCQHNL